MLEDWIEYVQSGLDCPKAPSIMWMTDLLSEGRARTAMDYLVAFDNYRRGIRENSPASFELARTHAATLARIRLFFDEPVTKSAERAGGTFWR